MLIVGGGAVGSALACAFAELPLDVVLVEARETAKLEQPSFDGRTTALANASQKILAALGIWPELGPRAEPIRTVHVSERGRFGAARITAEEEGVEALGYTVENAALGRALWERLRARPRLRVLAPATVAELSVGRDAAEARIEPGARTVACAARGRRGRRTLLGSRGARRRRRSSTTTSSAR